MTLDTGKITDAALDLLREEGLDGVTFRKLTARLNVKAPAIYWRFAGKQELLEAMAEAILATHLAGLGPHDGREPWQDWFTDLLHRLRQAMLDYPDGARVVTGARPQGTPTLGLLAEHALSAAVTAGLDLADAAARVFTALHFTFGRAIEEQDSTGASIMDDTARAEFAAQFPTVARVLRHATEKSVTPRDAFDAGLQLILR
ncbi:TetR/AcrR family transcriptional regulator C-terminal domain-containing protein [Hamadaea sp. NPDC050747]|uniref:TetR/AcrR family transcriptional regulator C-terminal domain-containing protein n=1 Tax=Hamadaea sp. NPDC050747 TaxID=3155789 RepID=UPI0033D52E55